MSPTDLVSDLLRIIRNQFYPDTPKAWFQQRDAILLCITRPARWFSDRGVSFPPRRYELVLHEILRTVKRHGATSEIRWFPGYLGRCIEEYLKHHGDDLYLEAKGSRNQAELALSRVRKGPAPAGDSDAVAPLLQARQILLQARKSARSKRSATPLQTTLPGL